MPRAAALSERVLWWPSALYQTSTLELRRDGERLAIDLGVAPWEMEEVLAARPEPVTELLLTHADWDHVVGCGALPEATVWGSAASAQRIASGEAGEGLSHHAGQLYVPLRAPERLRVDRPLEPPCSAALGPWSVEVLAAPGHMPDVIATLFPEERLFVVGDYLSALEIPFVNSSAADYRETLERLIGVIQRERPAQVASGHGHPLSADAALRVAHEDLAYLEALLAHARAGRGADEAAAVPHPARAGAHWDGEAHHSNVEQACREAAGA